ncbi:hypothetical protein H2200_009281 [Cladophialophora chaetospira]|uniref:Uncharacterized protein n=1 Tax=Cladophialophora chaetospira TaxID=386627 RepID=A0AA38X456_9EURO|nr:hypothetical protein H2200_009281 [Cladophialophora chaetospira]
MSTQNEPSTASARGTARPPTSTLSEGDPESSTATPTSSNLSLDQSSPPNTAAATTSHDPVPSTAGNRPNGANTNVTTSTNLEHDGAQSHRASFFAWCKGIFSDSWVPEIAAVIFSILCLIAIVITLAVFDKKARPQLTHHITFNTIISILATGTRSSLMYTTASILGQKKWTWFTSRPRRLRDMQTLDGASRGPLGSLNMLFGRIAASTASLGALITVLALAFDPFVQQLIDYPLKSKVVPSPNASTRRATFIPDLGNLAVPRFTAVKDAVALGTFSDNFPRNPVCPTQNCTYPEVRSVSWCSKCEDVTGQGEITDCDRPIDWDLGSYSDGQSKYTNCKISLPGFEALSLFVNATRMDSEWLEVSGTYQYVSQLLPLKKTNSNGTNTTSDFELQQRTVLHMAAIGIEPGSGASGWYINTITKCGISPCLNTYSVSVQDTREHTKLVNSRVYQSVLRNLTNLSEDVSMSPLKAATCFELDDSPKNYTKVQPSISVVPSFVDTEHDSFCIFSWLLSSRYAANYNWASPLDAWIDPIAQAISATVSFNSSVIGGLIVSFDPDASPDSYFDHILYHGGLQSVLTNITDSLTSLNLEYSTETISGSIVEPVVFVRVRWQWITLPAILVAAAAISLIMAIVETRSNGAEVWKDSTLAVLYHGIDESVMDSQKMYSKASDVDKAARLVDVQLTRDTNSGRLRLRPQHRPEKA